ncbi:hypothetical protein [Labrenzia sp. PHM005]|uniref:hypothetical protein n=1 Tax=Labrenzia sp. PHM005 TaxID=2590016 RepID=UPI001140890F|nr:hypothetical protein [Labrenzia sp. PHM005]QDG75805.1 hypothetical protein FJ695_08005 [Labrenzia sp. PHM005]
MGQKKTGATPLLGEWIHSSEEDTADSMVFRPPQHQLPPSRGRAAFRLNNDNSYAGAGIGPADVSNVTEGRWEIDEEDGLKVRIEHGDQVEILEVLSVAADRLEIRKKQ